MAFFKPMAKRRQFPIVWVSMLKLMAAKYTADRGLSVWFGAVLLGFPQRGFRAEEDGVTLARRLSLTT